MISAMVLMGLVLPMVAPPPLAEAQGSCYFESAELTFTIHENRWVDVQNSYTVYNPHPAWTFTIEQTTIIPTPAVEELSIQGISYGIENTGDNIVLRMNLEVPGKQRRTYQIFYSADNLISGSGPAYRGRFGGGIKDSKFRYDNYVVTVQGPRGASAFLTNPSAEDVAEDPPTVRHENRLEVGDDFNGLYVAFYTHPVYFKITLTESFTNLSSENSREVWLYSILFGQMGPQSAALASGPPLKAMYVDEDNNWHAVFDIGTIRAGTSRMDNIELIFELNLHESGATEFNTGSIEDIPAQLPSYENYLREDQYWEVNNQLILRKAQEIRGGENNAYLLAKKIVEWVAGEIEYEERERQGALETLKTKKGDCDCFSDLTIALGRAAGLPARASSGWVYENAELGGHAWVEFYLPNHGWQPADPTWAKDLGNYLGRLDSIHLLRATQGLSSTRLVSRVECYGSVPQFGENKNLVLLTPSQAAEEFIASAEIVIGMAEQLLGGGLTNARSLLDQALIADTDTKISLAKQALGQANGIIRELGKAPEREAPEGKVRVLLPEWLIWICVAVVAAGIVAVAGIKLRSRTRRPPTSPISTETF